MIFFVIIIKKEKKNSEFPISCDKISKKKRKSHFLVPIKMYVEF